MSTTHVSFSAGDGIDANARPIVLMLFVGSGMAALIFEIVWFQLLDLVIGSSAVSIGVLLGTFMAWRRSLRISTERLSWLFACLPPTLAMGATLPPVARWVEATPEGMSSLGFFYAGNDLRSSSPREQ